MKRATKWALALLVGVAVLCIWAIKVQLDRAEPGAVAKIYLDGALIQTIDLNEAGTAYTFPIESEGGGTNLILVEHGRIRVKEANCPDRVCVHQGWISDDSIPIVCLPHKLVIRVEGGGDDIDAATG